MSNSWKFFDKQSDKVERVLKKYSLLLYYIPVIPCFAGEQSRGELNRYKI